MFKDNFKDVLDMHHKFQIPLNLSPKLVSKEIYDFRIKFLREELTEFEDAVEKCSLPDQIDALVDLVVVALGTAAIIGFNWHLHWREVHWWNMRKERVIDASESKRGSSIDLKKPEGWVGPNHERIINGEYKENHFEKDIFI